ncbi:MAG: hypothetical protein AAF515_05115 [Pseudomonadota bacterium]
MKVNGLHDCIVGGQKINKGAQGVEVADEAEARLMIEAGHLEDASGAIPTGEYDPQGGPKRVPALKGATVPAR